MFHFLNRCSRRRTAWILLAISTLSLELTALYFQHVMLLAPCVLCIYERVALFGIFAAAVLGAIAPSTPLLRYPAITLWMYSAWQGLELAMYHTKLQLYPSPFQSCDMFVNFPDWLPIHKWAPGVFEAYGDCALRQWDFLSLDMPQWLIGVFAAYLVVGAVVIISQFFDKPKSV